MALVDGVSLAHPEFQVYRDYARQFGSVLFLLVAFCFAAAQFSQVLSDWWLGRWAENDVVYIIGYRSDWPRAKVLNHFLAGYGLLALLQVCFAATKVIFVQLAGLRAARLLHERMLRMILGAPTSFFDITPVGRIVNRFSSDMELVDNQVRPMIVTCFKNHEFDLYCLNLLK